MGQKERDRQTYRQRAQRGRKRQRPAMNVPDWKKPKGKKKKKKKRQKTERHEKNRKENEQNFTNDCHCC